MQQRLPARKTSGGRGLEDWGCGGKVSWTRSRPVAGGGEILLCGEAQNLPCISVISDLVSEKEESHTDFYRTAEQEEASLRVGREVEEPERSGWATTRGVTTGELGRRGRCMARFN